MALKTYKVKGKVDVYGNNEKEAIENIKKLVERNEVFDADYEVIEARKEDGVYVFSIEGLVDTRSSSEVCNLLEEMEVYDNDYEIFYSEEEDDGFDFDVENPFRER